MNYDQKIWDCGNLAGTVGVQAECASRKLNAKKGSLVGTISENGCEGKSECSFTYGDPFWWEGFYSWYKANLDQGRVGENQGKILALDDWYKEAQKCKTYWTDDDSESSGMNYYTRFYCYGGEYKVFGVTATKKYWGFIIVLVNFLCLGLMMFPNALSLSNIRCIRRKFQVKYSTFQAEVKNFTLRLNLYLDQDQTKPDDILACDLWYHVGNYFIDQEPD